MAEMYKSTIQKLCRANGGYRKPEWNSELLLNSHGFTRIRNLEPYTGTRCLCLQCNAISQIEGLDTLSELRTLYLQNNCLMQLANLGALTRLAILDISSNWIRDLSGIEALLELETLIAAGNRLTGLESIQPLRGLKRLECVDLSRNRIRVEGEGEWFAFWSTEGGSFSHLSALDTQGNPLRDALQGTSYRKRLIAALPALLSLDDKPIPEEERKVASAFVVGGSEAERSAREEHRAGKKRELRDMLNAAYALKARGRAKQAQLQLDSQEQVGPEAPAPPPLPPSDRPERAVPESGPGRWAAQTDASLAPPSPPSGTTQDQEDGMFVLEVDDT